MARTTMVPNRSTQPEEVQDLHLYLGGLVPEPVYAWERALGRDDTLSDLIDDGFGSSRTLLDVFDRQIDPYRGKSSSPSWAAGGWPTWKRRSRNSRVREHLVDAREMKAFRDSLRKGFAERRSGPHFRENKRSCPGSPGTTGRRVTPAISRPCWQTLSISGYILTQLNDVAWEFHAGLLDIWRKPKPAYAASKRLNQPHVLILNIPSDVVSPDCKLA